ncbi:periplasmic protein involved in polysaccharide export [Opitutaceae bacterium TAV1]|nr:periplasmic protein involved in polysaccharide export [Opitutaceae bacterium TAV1]
MTIVFRLMIIPGVAVMAAAGLVAQTESGVTSSSQVEDYALIPSDFIRVQVFQEDDATREVSVTRNGTISLPLIGDVGVQGKTVRQVEKEIAGLYVAKDIYQNPQVTVSLLRYAERSVSVIGCVNQPGTVIFPPEKPLGLVEAIARAGGFSRLANRSEVRLTRTEADGQTRSYVINVDKLLAGKNSDNAWYLRPGDVIFVKESII